MSSPFDEAKYRALLNGLEVTEVGFKDLETIIDYRIEAEFFDKRFLHTDELFKKITWKPFFKIADYENGRAYSSDEFGVKGGIKVSKIGDVTNKRLIANWETLSYSEFNNQKGTKLTEDDILMSLTGDPPDVGKVNLISNITEPATFNQRVARVFLRHTQSDFISAKVFFAVLANRHCREQLERFAKGIRQRNLGIECLELLKIPIFKDDFQRLIDSLIIKSYEQSKIHQTKYQQAEALLLSELGLQDWQPSEANTAEISMAESFLSSGRLDAEYYQPKYDELEAICEKNAKYIKIVKEIQILNSRGLQPEYVENGDLNVINSRHILDTQLDYENFEKTDFNNWDSQLKARVYKNDILTYTTGAGIGKTQTYLSDKKALASNHVNILRIKSEKPIYVGFVINSIVGKMQTEKVSAGSAQQELYPKDLDEFYVPFVTETAQNQIISLIEQSQFAQAESKRLFALAKEAVEVAIEQNEEAAKKLISSSLTNLE